MIDFIPPNVLTLISAVFLAGAQSFYRQALRDLSPRQATIAANLAVAGYASAIYWIEGGVSEWPLAGIGFFVLGGLFANFLARYLIYFSFQTIGLARSQVMAQTQPIWSSLVAILFLSEGLTGATAAGTLAIVGGAMLLVREKRPEGKAVPLLHYVVPVLSAMSFAFAPTLRKLGFAYIPSAAFGLACSSLAAVGIQLLVSPFLRPEPEGASVWNRRGAAAILSGGLINAVSAYIFWTAIKNGVVVEVVPIRRLSVLFVLLFSWWFFREQERVTKRVVAGALLSVAGAVAVAAGR